MYFATAAALGFQTPPQMLVGVELSCESLNAPLFRGQMVIGRHGVNPSQRYLKFKARNPKHETRNKFECSKKQKFSNNFNLDSAFWIFFGFGFIWLRFVSVRGTSFDIRISDFLSLASWRDKVC